MGYNRETPKRGPSRNAILIVMKSEREHKEISELISSAKAGDSRAFDSIYRQYFTPVYRYIFIRIGGNRAEAEDIAQNTFVKIFKNLVHFEDRGKNPLTYFFTVARTTLIDHYRKKREQNFSDLPDESFDVADPSVDNEAVFDRNLRVTEAVEAMEELTEDQRTVISLRFFGERTTIEIAEAMGKSEDAVRQIQSRGLRFLSQKVKKSNIQE